MKQCTRQLAETAVLLDAYLAGTDPDLNLPDGLPLESWTYTGQRLRRSHDFGVLRQWREFFIHEFRAIRDFYRQFFSEHMVMRGIAPYSIGEFDRRGFRAHLDTLIAEQLRTLSALVGQAVASSLSPNSSHVPATSWRKPVSPHVTNNI